jgi:indolepyruvate ferredoxin oxidoreductase alpha subunit
VAAIDTKLCGLWRVWRDHHGCAQLCPSFYKVTKVENASWLEKIKAGISRLMIGRSVVRPSV